MATRSLEVSSCNHPDNVIRLFFDHEQKLVCTFTCKNEKLEYVVDALTLWPLLDVPAPDFAGALTKKRLSEASAELRILESGKNPILALWSPSLPYKGVTIGDNDTLAEITSFLKKTYMDVCADKVPSALPGNPVFGLCEA